MDLSSKSNPDLCSLKKNLIILIDLVLTFDQKVKQYGTHDMSVICLHSAPMMSKE